MHKQDRAEPEGGDGPADWRSSASPVTNPVESHLELGQLLAVVELFATIQNLTRDQQEEVQSLSSWIHGWLLQEADGLKPPVLQFIRECVRECLSRSKSRGPIYAFIQPPVAQMSIH